MRRREIEEERGTSRFLSFPTSPFSSVNASHWSRLSLLSLLFFITFFMLFLNFHQFFSKIRLSQQDCWLAFFENVSNLKTYLSVNSTSSVIIGFATSNQWAVCVGSGSTSSIWEEALWHMTFAIILNVFSICPPFSASLVLFLSCLPPGSSLPAHHHSLKLVHPLSRRWDWRHTLMFTNSFFHSFSFKPNVPFFTWICAHDSATRSPVRVL